MDLQYVWVAKYNDGTSLAQTEGHKFADIAQDKLIALEVYENDSGKFVLAIPFPKGADLICFIRHTHSKFPDGSEVVHKDFWFGYKMLVGNTSVKNLVFIREDGLIVMMNDSGRND